MIEIWIVAAIGLIAGLILAVSALVFGVEKDELEAEILEALPGINCGACGFSGCGAYAAALRVGSVPNGLCLPGGNESLMAISELLGVEAALAAPKVARVKCQGGTANTQKTMVYDGLLSCRGAMQLYQGDQTCRFGCLGFGDCERVCDAGAIQLVDGVARVDGSRCVGCGKCVAGCPKGLIAMGPVGAKYQVRCQNTDRGAQARKACQRSCIGCTKCLKACHYGAIEVKDFCSRIDPAKCTGCGACAAVCPMGCIK